MDRLIVKNFGPLKDVDIELNKINLFIGANGSGKSVLAKIVTIILDMSHLYDNPSLFEEKILEKFQAYNINYITQQSIIQYYNENELLISFFENDLKINFEHKLFRKIESEYNQEQEKQKNTTYDASTPSSLIEAMSQIDSLNKILPKYVSQYIPAERNLISIFNKYVTTFITADIPLPKFLLNFSSQYVRAREEIRELNLLNVKYKFQSDQERIFYNDQDYLLLERSSSGIQSALPLYLTVKYFAKKHRNIIIEEPEQNLFPKAQKETIEYIIEQVSDENNLFMMTHSPYVLSTLNILMMAHKAGNLNEESKKEVSELFNETQWINPDNFSAYYLENGIARDIKGRTGLISENEIDEISNDIQDEFEELLAIYREHKNDK